jgi:hypothetical protein
MDVKKVRFQSLSSARTIVGTYLLPAIRDMLREYYSPSISSSTLTPLLTAPPSRAFVFENELCLSIHSMSAVAQGCSVRAAIQSQTIPFHELKSALMLDTCPYPIGAN